MAGSKFCYATYIHVRLTVTHASDREDSRLIGAVAVGWPKVLSNLKSLLKTGSAALSDPYPA